MNKINLSVAKYNTNTLSLVYSEKLQFMYNRSITMKSLDFLICLFLHCLFGKNKTIWMEVYSKLVPSKPKQSYYSGLNYIFYRVRKEGSTGSAKTKLKN